MNAHRSVRSLRPGTGSVRGLHLSAGAQVTTLAVGMTLAVAVGTAQPISMRVAAIAAGAVLLSAVIAWFDLLGVAVVLTAALPWLVVLSEILPRLTLTFVAGATAAAVLLVAAPKS